MKNIDLDLEPKGKKVVQEKEGSMTGSEPYRSI